MYWNYLFQVKETPLEIWDGASESLEITWNVFQNFWIVFFFFFFFFLIGGWLFFLLLHIHASHFWNPGSGSYEFMFAHAFVCILCMNVCNQLFLESFFFWHSNRDLETKKWQVDFPEKLFTQKWAKTAQNWVWFNFHESLSLLFAESNLKMKDIILSFPLETPYLTKIGQNALAQSDCRIF